ncbi:MAG: ABC transporter permease subunit [Bacillota bacterium]|nr:ABC transporter permease subunit [Bacillota bacterium]
MSKENKKDIKNEQVNIDGQPVNKALQEEAVTSPSKMAFRNFMSNKLGVTGLVGFLLIVLIVFVGSRFLEYDPYYTQGIMKNVSPGSGYMSIPGELTSEGIKDISVGTTFSVGLSEAGKVYVWGHEPAFKVPMPQEVKDNQGNIKLAAAGDKHILVATNDNKVIGWGQNNFKQAELPQNLEKLIAEEGLQRLGGSDMYSVILTDEGTIRAWGSTLPSGLDRIPSKYDQNVVDFATGSTNILILTKDGKLAVIGQKGTELSTSMPEELGLEGDKTVVAMGRMRYAGFAVDSEGQTYAWGNRADGAFDVPEMQGTVVKISSAKEHINALTDEGYVYSWGNNNYDAIVHPTGSGYIDIYSGYFNNYAIKDEGHAYDSWGLDGFFIGSDDQGRDMFTRTIHGGKLTLIIALVSVVIQVVIGVIVGIVAGFYGGWVDNVLIRFSEIVSAFPFYPMIITLSALLPVDVTQNQRLAMIMVILGFLNWPGIAILVRGEILSVREKDYITAAKALGLKEGKIMFSHMLPNIISIIIVRATIGYAGGLLTESALSFLGFGVQEPFPSWGNILNAAQKVEVLEQYWWRWIFPGTMVFLTALTVNLIGDAMRDALDPKAQER